MEYLPEKLHLPAYMVKPFILALVLVLLWIALRILKSRISRSDLDYQIKYRTKKAVSFLAYLVFMLFVVSLYSDSLGGLNVALGVAGAGIAFALQEVIASVAGWMALLFGNFYKTGDRVQLGGIKGDVIDIGVLRTTLMELGSWVDGDLYNGRIVRIANSFVFKEPVFNYSADFPFLWDEIKIPVRFGSDYNKARNIILEVANKLLSDFSQQANETWAAMKEKYMIEHATTEPMVTIVVTDNWVEYTLRYTVDFKRRRITKDQLFTEILTAFSQSEGSVQFASATFDIVGLPRIDVKIQRDE
ncbi:MAG: mechanosensitive ion channel protein MscS [Cyclobacteriaceae bacterium]|nr:MAG: mechanosensitive ion channel protein MscS [Cyclobacteriaceae bacterium]